jgi:lipid II:glycine glycyltransferase (peptidoglycan interpeptide bridge formation enzyme)
MDMGYISEFIRFHPILENYKLRECNRMLLHKTFGVNFLEETSGNLEFWKDSFKRGVKRAQKFGLSFEIQALNKENLSNFIEIYKSTMQRNKAFNYYFFESEYWNLLLELSKKSECILANVLYKGKTISSAIFLIWRNTYIHYHLGGSIFEYLNMRPNNFLFWNIEKWAAENGFVIMHIGGGVDKDDGLEKFKEGISNTSFDFYIGRNILDERMYSVLNTMAIRINDKKFNRNFFPSYRSIF